MEAASTRVLLVEDEPIDVLLVDRSLRREGTDQRFEVRHAFTLAQGLAQLQRDAVDVLLVDLALPDSEGSDTVSRVRDRNRRVPLVVFTGSDDPELAARTFEAGADEYLVKGGFDAALLRRTIHHAIERRRLRLRTDPPKPRRDRDLRAEDSDLLHDLKNLHTCILGNAEILQREMGDRDWIGRRAEALLGAARFAAELTQQLSARAIGERQARLVEPAQFLRGVEPLLRAAVPEHVELGLEIADRLPAISICAERVRGALLELVVNAVDAIGSAAGRIDVWAGTAVIDGGRRPDLVAPAGLAAGLHVCLEVSDTGVGFDLAGLPSLFERGFSTKGPDRGRGLSDLREILAEHRAGLWVRSQPGRGSAFRMLLPSNG
jgi:signal transduction histidine kinase